jgi:hypothetical protein
MSKDVRDLLLVLVLVVVLELEQTHAAERA